MKTGRIFSVVLVALLAATACTVALAQDAATAQEVVAKVREAASVLAKTGDLAPFQQKQGPWVWKDSYIFIQNCDKKVIAAHPIKPEQVGQELSSIKDGKSGKTIFPEGWCEKVESAPSGVWDQYWWPKPGATEPSRKLAYHLPAKGTPYVVSAGIYDNKATVADLSAELSKSKMSSMK